MNRLSKKSASNETNNVDLGVDSSHEMQPLVGNEALRLPSIDEKDINVAPQFLSETPQTNSRSAFMSKDELTKNTRASLKLKVSYKSGRTSPGMPELLEIMDT